MTFRKLSIALCFVIAVTAAGGAKAAKFFYPDETGIAWFSSPESAATPQPQQQATAAPAKEGGGIVSDSGKYQYEETPEAEDSESAAIAAASPHAIPADHKPMIAIVIDDMGVDRKRSARAMDDLPAAVTFSFLPYSTDIEIQAEKSIAKGHEIIVHMPMQPERATADPGPNYLGVDMPASEIRAHVLKNLSLFKGYDGVNNHMGSKFTCDRAGLETVMKILRKRDLYFLDSKTIAQSVAEDVARENGLPTSHRDVFIDNTESVAAVAQSLRRIEYVAKHAGTAIAIGHPKDVTLDGLEKWLPTLKDKGFDLVPLRTVISLRTAHHRAAAAAGHVAKADVKKEDAVKSAPVSAAH
ncbi:MAG: divergent polysaccharide deacetylase family protein [Alphaproteobacteria bacterium]|nr:divergent polysaccharide deacetylase family protein [Alphaproteobacteria bacterium]